MILRKEVNSLNVTIIKNFIYNSLRESVNVDNDKL